MPTTRTAGLILIAGTAAVLLGCSGGNNNKSANSSNNAATVQAVAASATVVRTPAPAAGSAAPARTATPGGARTATPAVAANAGARTPTPLPVGSAANRDAALQSQLEKAALASADLPTGFTADGDPDRDLSDASEVAAYGLTFTKIDQSTASIGIQAIYDGLTGFKDTATAQAQFKSVQNQFTQNAGGDFQLQPITNGPQIGDDTLSFKVSGQASGITVAGYAIVWRRGRLAAVLVQIGTPEIKSIDDTAVVARLQDSKLQTVR